MGLERVVIVRLRCTSLVPIVSVGSIIGAVVCGIWISVGPLGVSGIITGQGIFFVVYVFFSVGWADRGWGTSDWGNKGVIVSVGQIWWSGPRELRISMGSGECIAGDHPRHGTEYLVFFSVFILLRVVRTRMLLVMQIATDV